MGNTSGKYKNGSALLQWDKSSSHSPQRELDFLLACDKIHPQPGDECYLISSHWMKQWMEFAHGRAELKTVGPIDNSSLVERVEGESNKYRTKTELEFRVDFRCISKVMWEYLFRHYSGSPVVGFYIPLGVSHEDMKSKAWLEHIIFKNVPTVLFPQENNIPTLELPSPLDLSFRNITYSDNVGRGENDISLVVGHLKQQLGTTKLQSASSMNDDIEMAKLKRFADWFRSTNQKFDAKVKIQSALNMISSGTDFDQNDARMLSDMLRENAGIYLQLVLRDFYLQKKAADLQAKQAILRQTGAALLLQGVWRARVAKKHRLALKKETSALKIQAMARRLFAKQESKEIRAAVKTNSACSTIQRWFRAAMGKKKLIIMLNSFHPHTLVASLRSVCVPNAVKDLKSDRYVVACMFSVESRGRSLTQSRQDIATGFKGAKKKRLSYTILDPENKKDNMTMMSFYRSIKATPFAANANKCDWNSTKGSNECLMTNGGPTSKLVFSVFEKSTFLGQAVVDIRDYASRLYAGETVELKELPLHTKFPIQVHDVEQGRGIITVAPEQGDHNVGHLTMSLKMPTLTRSMSGWVQRASNAFMHSGELKRRWMVLMNQKLLCFEDPYTLHVSKGELDLRKMYSVAVNKADGSLEIRFGQEGKNAWTIQWDEDEAEHIQEMWHRKFVRCVPRGIKIPESLRKLKSKKKLKAGSSAL